MADTWVVDGGPRGGTYVPPEFFLGAERVQHGGCTSGGGEGRAVESG